MKTYGITIERYIKNKSRLLEIIGSMPRPAVEYQYVLIDYANEIYELKVLAFNRGGVCMYIYHSERREWDRIKREINELI